MNPKLSKGGKPNSSPNPDVHRMSEVRGGMIQIETFIKEAAAMVADEIQRVEEIREGFEAMAAAREAETAEREERHRLTSQVRDLENRLRESEELLKVRDAEINDLKSKRKEADLVAMKSVMLEEIKGNFEAAAAAFVAQMREKEDLLQGKDSVLKRLEESLGGRIQDLENRLTEREELLKIRDGELKDLESKIAAVRASLESVVVLEEDNVVDPQAGSSALRNGKGEEESKESEEAEAVAELKMIENFMRGVVKRPRTAIQETVRHGDKSSLLSLLAPVKKKSRRHGEETF